MKFKTTLEQRAELRGRLQSSHMRDPRYVSSVSSLLLYNLLDDLEDAEARIAELERERDDASRTVRALKVELADEQSDCDAAEARAERAENALRSARGTLRSIALLQYGGSESIERAFARAKKFARDAEQNADDALASREKT